MKKLLLIFSFSLFAFHLFPQAGPLLTTNWNQGCFYNADCPVDGAGPCGRTYTGCNATAIAMILKYHNHPTTGWGSHSYTPAGYPLQSANFAATTYNWGTMPNSLAGANAEVAKLMYHCGVGVDMQYGPSGSNSYFDSQIFKEYFKYSLSTRGAMKFSYTNTEWEDLIKAELNAGRVVFVKGGNHFFVIDGYVLSPLRYHLNFGWGGAYNGNYDLHNVVVAGNNYTPSQAIIGIKPLIATEAAPDTLTVGAGGGTTTYELASLTSWTLSSSQAWLVPSMTSGVAGYYSYLTGANSVASANPAYTRRYANLIITDGVVSDTIVVEQLGIQPSLSASPNNLTYGAAGGSQNINISSDSSWTVSSPDLWLSFLPPNGTGNTTVSATASVNPSPSSRMGTIIATRGNLQSTVSVLQAGNGSFWCTPIIATPHSNGITNVNLHTLNRNSGIDEGYLYTAFSTTLKRDTSYTISVTFSGGNAPAVWIDWNIDGDFADAGEAVVCPACTWYPTFNATKTQIFTVPTAAVLGTTRMRVYAKVFGAGPVSGPCNVSDNGGDIEDYDIVIIDQRHITVTPSSLNYTDVGGLQTLNVDCDSAWNVSTLAPWLSLSVPNGIGNGTVDVTATTNTSTTPRNAVVTFTRGAVTASVAITQDGADTVLTASPLAINFPSTGTILSFNVTSNVSYTITPSQPWISPSAANGTGDGPYDIIVGSNPSGTTRSGTVDIQSGTFIQTIVVTQDSTSMLLVVAPDTLWFPWDGGNQNVALTTPGSWTASISDPWFTTDFNSGTGNSTIVVSVDTNLTIIPRSGTVTFTNGLVSAIVVVMQDSSAEALSANPLVLNYVAAGGTQNVGITSNGTWTATTGDAWITPGVVGGTGDDSLSITVSVNTIPTPRTGSVVLQQGPLSVTIIINQDSAAFTLTSNPDTLFYTSTGGSQDVLVFSNGNWNASSPNAWLTLGLLSGIGDDTTAVTASANPGAPRFGIVYLSGGGIADTVIVVQDSAFVAGIHSSGEISAIKIFPNPTSSELFIQSENYAGIISIYSSLGVEVMKGEIKKGITTLNVSSLSSGIYFVRFGEGGIRFVKE